MQRREFVLGAAGLGCPPGGLRVALDVGHYRAAAGATAASGESEFTYNLMLARLALAGLRAAGFASAFLIGESGDVLPLAERTRRAHEGRAGLFLSLHHDSVQPQYLRSATVGGRVSRYCDTIHGYGVFVSATNPHAVLSRRFADGLGGALIAAGLTPSLHHAEKIPGEGRTLLDPHLGIYRFDELAVLRTATMPATLLETAVIVNHAEEAEVRSGRLHALVVQAVVRAVGGFCAA